MGELSLTMALKKAMKHATSTKMSLLITLSLIAAIIVLIFFAAMNVRRLFSSNHNGAHKAAQGDADADADAETERFSDKPSFQIIYAYHKTCPHCIKFNDTFDLVAKSFAQNVESHDTEVVKVEKDKLENKYSKHVDGFPTVLIFKDNEYKTKLVGNNTSHEFAKFLEDALTI